MTLRHWAGLAPWLAPAPCSQWTDRLAAVTRATWLRSLDNSGGSPASRICWQTDRHRSDPVQLMMPTAAVLEVEPVMTAKCCPGLRPDELALMLETCRRNCAQLQVELIEEAQAEKTGKLREAKKLEGKGPVAFAKREIESRWAGG